MLLSIFDHRPLRLPARRTGGREPAWPKRIVFGRGWVTLQNAQKTGFSGDKFRRRSQSRKEAKMFRAGLYARVSTNDQQTLAMQNRAMREYAARRARTIALQVREVNSGAAQRKAREKILEAARRREIRRGAGLAVGSVGRSVTDLLVTLQELEHLGVGFVSLTGSAGPGDSSRSSNGGHARRFRLLRARGIAGANSRRPGSCTAERQAVGPAGNRGSSRCGNPKSASCWC